MKKKIAFICVHNSCRSQIAEALGNHLRGDEFDFYSAGTETKPQINQDAVRLMKELYGINMELTQYSKTIDKIPQPDVAISMGCDVGCPFIGRAFDDDWGLPDPTGKSDTIFRMVIESIERNILLLSRYGNKTADQSGCGTAYEGALRYQYGADTVQQNHRQDTTTRHCNLHGMRRWMPLHR